MTEHDSKTANVDGTVLTLTLPRERGRALEAALGLGTRER
jgi:hypothetical protein